MIDFKLCNLFDYRDKAIIMLLYNTGALPWEIANLRVKNYDNVKNNVTFEKDTGSRTLDLNMETSEMINQYLSRKGDYAPDSLIFESKKDNPINHKTLFTIINKRVMEAGIKEKIYGMMFRYTFGDRKLKEGMDIRELQKLLGHSHTYLTQRFMFIIPNNKK